MNIHAFVHTEPKMLELKIHIYRICKFLQLFRIDYRLAFNMEKKKKEKKKALFRDGNHVTFES